MSQKLKEEDRIISVLSDGLGSGIKASVLSAMTATMAMNYTAMNESILQTALSIIHTLPKDMVRKISYSQTTLFTTSSVMLSTFNTWILHLSIGNCGFLFVHSNSLTK